MSTSPVCAPEGLWRSTWLPLSDPLTRSLCPPALVFQEFFEHSLAGHPNEPFADLFGPALASDFLGCFDPTLPASHRDIVLSDCSRRLELAVGTVLGEGPVLAYDVVDDTGERITTWLVVLPCGALVPIRCYEHYLCPCSLYFPAEGLACKTLEARYRRVVAELAGCYTVPDYTINAVVQPPPDHVVSVAGERRTNIRFAHHESWGFLPELTGQPWRGRPPLPSPAAAAGLRSPFRPAHRQRWRQS
jgi:hypothetical protein